MPRRIVSAAVALSLLSGCASAVDPAFTAPSPLSLQYLSDSRARCAQGDKIACENIPAAQHLVDAEQLRLSTPDPTPSLGLAVLGVVAVAALVVLDAQQPSYVLVRRCAFCW